MPSLPLIPSLVALSILGLIVSSTSSSKSNKKTNNNNATFKKGNKNKKLTISKEDIEFIDSQASLPSIPFRNRGINKKRVIVSLTTSPDRLKFVPFILKTLDLSLVDQVHVNLPFQFQNKKGPDFEYKKQDLDLLKENDKVKIFFQEKDLGPIMKLLPTLIREKEREKEKEEDVIIITIDDDMAHGKYFLYNCLDHLETNPEADVFVHTTWPEWILGKKYALHSKKENDQMLKEFGHNFLMVEGFQGVAYRLERVKDCIDDLLFYSQKNRLCFKNDDVVISAILNKKGKKIQKFTPRSKSEKTVKTRMLSYGFGPDALHKNLEHHGVYYQVLKTCFH